jgi:hypothetical protein
MMGSASREESVKETMRGLQLKSPKAVSKNKTNSLTLLLPNVQQLKLFSPYILYGSARAKMMEQL